MTLFQLFLFLSCIIGCMVALDWLLGKVKKDWKLMPWEEDEQDGLREV